MRIQDYSLAAELHSGYKKLDTLSFSEPVRLDLSLLTQIYLKYHGFRFASMFIDYDFELHLTFQELPENPEDSLISHSVLIPKPVHIADVRLSLIPELIWAFNNYNIANGEFILPKINEVYRNLRNENR